MLEAELDTHLDNVKHKPTTPQGTIVTNTVRRR